ncbi:MAG TPA: hypothetical protein VER55_15320 [Ardenticatenaceae bacterium]|nr:hypothetical protein [Ardenticatenaceae bacterium]
MRQLRLWTIALLVDLAIVFNIERLDFNQPNLIDIRSFVYVLVMLAAVSVLALRQLWRSPAYVAVLLWIGVYYLCRLVVASSHPLLGGINTYLTVTELTVIVATTLLAHRVARHVQDFEDAVENLTFPARNRRVQSLEEAAEEIQTELTRSRRYHNPLSVIVVEPEPETLQAALHRTVQEVQQRMMTRYVLTRMARMIVDEVRRTDMIIEQPGHGRFIILTPETDAANSKTLINRIRTAATAQMGVAVACGVATFPYDALTFEELVREAETHLTFEELMQHDEAAEPDAPNLPNSEIENVESKDH